MKAAAGVSRFLLAFLAPVAPTPTKINNDSMRLKIDGRVIASDECHYHATAEAWTVSSYPAHLLIRNKAITAMIHREWFAAGHGDDDLFVTC